MKRLLALSLLVCASALAQNAGLMPPPQAQFFDAHGYPLAGNWRGARDRSVGGGDGRSAWRAYASGYRTG